MASPFDFIAQSIAAHNGSATQTSSAPTSPSSPRTSPLEDYYNEQMQQKQATEKARDIIDGRGRGLVGGLRDAWLDKHPNVTTISTALSDDEKFQLQRAYADAANKYKDASKKAQSVSDKKVQSIRPEAGVNYATTLEKYRSELQAASDEKAAAESEMDKLRKQLEFYNVELPDVDQNIFERLWGSIKGGSKQAAGSLGGLFGYTGRVATGGQSAVDKALRASGNEELSALYHVGTEEEDEKAMQMQQAIADKSAELSESGGRDIERSKWGASDAGRFALDAVSQVPALAADMAANAVLPGSGMAMMMGRSFGGGVQQAEAGGGNLAQAGAYGATSAAKEYLTEKMFGGLDLAYGKGFADTAVEKLVGKLAKTDIGRTVLRTIINGGGGEFVEEFVSSAVDPTLRAIYNGKSIGENYSEEQVSDWLYDGLVGAALGIAGSGVSIATGADAKKNAELRSGEVDKAFELMTGKKAATEPQSAAEAQGDITTPPTPSSDAVARPETLNSAVNNDAETQNADVQKNTAPNGTESTAVNDNPATHTAEENKIIADYKAAADENVISGIERARSLQDINYRNKFTVTLAETVGDRVVNLVKNATGLDVTGFKNQIKGNSIAHIDKRHGVNGTADHSMANIEDFGRINYVVENADRARLLSAGDVDSETWKLSREYRNADNSQAPLIRFEKRVDNTYYVVEAVPDSKANRMAVVSAYMETAKKEASSPKSVDAAEAAPRATPEASLEISETSDNSIPTAEENVNRGQAENSVNANPKKTAEELAEDAADAALEKAKADYQETVKRWYEQHPEADSIPVTSSLYNANDWIKGRVKALLQKYYDAEDFDEYVVGANKMAEKTYNMEENAEKNNRDAFSAAILDSKLKSEAKTEGGYTDENLLDDTYKVEKEAFSSREEPVDKSVGTRLPSEVLEMLGIRKADIGVELEDQLRVLEREGKNARQAYEKAVELNDASGAAREMTRIKSLREAYNTAKAKLSKYRNGSMSDNEIAETERELHKEKHTVKGSKEFWESIAAKEAAIKAEAEKRRLQNSPNNDKVDSTNSKVERAKELLANGASPSQIFNETGLVVTADGKITDGFTRAKVGSYDNGQNGTADQVTGKNQVSGTSESGVSSDDGRGVRGEFSEQSREKASWEALGESDRNAAREVIQRRIDSVETEEADELRLSYDTDEELMRDIYKSYEDGSAALEEWTPYFGDMNELAAELDKALSGTNTNTQDANSNYNADNANHSTGSNTTERVYVDENGNEYDPKTGYTTRTAEEVQAERDAHISDDLYYTLRAEDRLTPDNAKEWAQWQQRREERQNAQKAPVPDETAWKDAEAEFGGANHDAIHEATQRAEEFETFLESDAFTSHLTDEQYTKVSDSVTEFKNKLSGLGDGHTSFAEFAEYYKAMKDSRILGDLYSERVNEQVQLARELAEEAYRNPIPYNVEKYRHAAVKAAQMTSHYIEKASKVRAELDELNNAVKENGSKRKPTELGREVERGEKGKSLREKAAAKFIRWQIMPRQMFQMIDGFKFWEKGAGYRMADTIENAAVKNQTTLVEADNFFTDVVKMKGYGDFATGKTKTNVRLGGKTLTMSEAVSLYKAIKTMGGPDAYRVQNIEGFALKNGDNKPYMIKADPANISELYSALQTAIAKNEVASAYVKAFDSMSEKLGKETQDVAKAIDGVDNELFKPGDYFPLTYARVEDVNSEWDKANSKDFGVPDFKNLKERTRTAGGYVNIAPVVEVTDGYIRRAADYIAFGELADTFGIMDYMHTFGTPTLVDSVKQNMGSEYGAWMENYVKDVQDINQTRAKSRDNWWQKLNHNFQTAVLIGNPGTPFKQKGSMWLAMSELDPRAVAKAAITSLNPGNQQIKAARNNPLLQFRAKGNIDSSITDALQDQSTLFGKMAAKIKVLKSIQNWIPAADVREVSKVYLASCYDVQMKNPGIDINSAKFKEMVDETFQRASMRTQSQYTMNMRDEISRGDSALLKALTMFQTQQRTTANSMFTAINEARAAKGTEHAAKANKALKNAATGFFASNVAYAAMDVLAKGLRHKLKQFRDDDEEQQIDAGKIGLELLKSFFEGVGGTVIFGDDVTNLVESIISGETFYENGIGAIGAIEDAVSAFWNLTQNPSADNIRKTAGGFANLAGIPLNNAYTLLNSMGMWTLDIINGISRSKQSSNDFWGFLAGAGQGTSAADIAGKKKAGLYSISDDPADDFLKILDSIKKAVDKLPPDQFTYTDENGDEVSYELTKADKEQYRKDAEASYNSGMDALLKAFGYDKLGDKAKEDVEKQIKGYAKDAAEQGYLDNKGLDYDTGAPAWTEAVPKEDVPSYLVSKKILDADGKKTDYDAIDYLIGGFSKIPSSVQTQLKDDGVNVNALLYAKLFGIGSEAWYSNKGATKDAEESLGASDVAKAIAVYNNMEGKSDEQILNAIKTQVLPDAGGKQSATVRRIEAYNTIAGNNADLGSWLDLAAALKDADVNDSVSKDDVYTAWANMGLSARETYAGITRSDFYNIVKSGVKSYAVNEDYATQVDEGYSSIVPAKEEADPTFSGSVRNHQADDSTAKSTSTFTMEDYYRALGLLK
jgi:hypothetical protein